jgi:hypothetical protein
MIVIRRIVPAVMAFLACSLPALAQGTSTADTSGGPTLLPVWGAILVFGFLFFGIGTSLGVRNRR